MYKNRTGQRIALFVYDSSTGLAVTGDAANITVSVSLDGGAFSSIGAPTEIGNGWYYIAPTASQTNGDLLVLKAVSVTANVVCDGLSLYPKRPNPDAVIRGYVSDVTPGVSTFQVGSPTNEPALSTVANFYVGAVVMFTSGTLKGMSRRVDEYTYNVTGPVRTCVFDSEWPVAPATNDEFVIAGRIE